MPLNDEPVCSDAQECAFVSSIVTLPVAARNRECGRTCRETTPSKRTPVADVNRHVSNAGSAFARRSLKRHSPIAAKSTRFRMTRHRDHRQTHSRKIRNVFRNLLRKAPSNGHDRRTGKEKSFLSKKIELKEPIKRQVLMKYGYSTVE